jgi:FKBP-type peptidyl-prolyl cis-trans isomerase
MIFQKLIKYTPVILSLIFFMNISLSSTQAAPPLLPMVFSGDVSTKDGKSTENQVLVAQILNADNSVLFTSQSTIVKDGTYIALTVGPLDPVVVGKNVKFAFMCGDSLCTDYADQTIPFQSAKVTFRYSLNFDTAPPSKSELEAAAAKAKADAAAQAAALKAEEEQKAKLEAAAAAAAVAKAKEVAEKEAAAKAEAEAKAKLEAETKAKSSSNAQSNTLGQNNTSSDNQSSQQLNAYPAIYSGSIVVAGANIPPDAVLKAQIGDYISAPALIDGNTFQNLVVSPGDVKYIDEPIIFTLNDVKSEPTKEKYESGSVTSQLSLAFVGLPVETPVKTTDTQPVADLSDSNEPSGSGCSLVSARNDNNYSGLLSFALILLVPLAAYKRARK